MNPHSPFFLIVDIFFVLAIWRNVLRPGAYPESIPLHIKWIHGLVLFYVVKLSFDSYVFDFMWLILHPHEFILCLSGDPNKIGSPIIGMVALLRGVAGTVLMRICFQMARRQKAVLTWYMILWPVHILCMSYMEYYLDVRPGNFKTMEIVVGVMIIALPSIFSVLFYVMPPVRSMFVEPKTANAPIVDA